jgi:methylenetetrahydrofolate reductase (NADPH)
VDPELWTRLESELEDSDTALSYHASNLNGEYSSNMDSTDANAVTWGVFPGQEIVQPTIIEEMSFKAWKVRLFLWEANYARKKHLPYGESGHAYIPVNHQLLDF